MVTYEQHDGILLEPLLGIAGMGILADPRHEIVARELSVGDESFRYVLMRFWQIGLASASCVAVPMRLCRNWFVLCFVGERARSERAAVARGIHMNRVSPGARTRHTNHV
jgi:hypothetical protein